MTTQQKSIRQPLGAMQSINKMLSGVPPNMSLQETRNLKIIYAKRQLQVDIPVKWTVNKVKCMLCTHFDILNFDKFQLQCNKMLIPGKTLVGHLPEDQLIVTKADCPKAFDKFYSKTIKQVIKKHNINTQSTLLPILGKDFSQAMTHNVPKERRKNIEQLPENINQRREDQDGAIVINLLRVIGLAFMANIIFSFASYWQMGVLVFIFCLYYLIDKYVKDNEMRRTRAQREAQKKLEEENKRKEDEKKRNSMQKKTIENKKEQKESFDLKRQVQQASAQNKIYQLHEDQTEENGIKRKYSEKIEQNRTNDEQYTSKQSDQPQMIKRPERQILKAKLKLWMAFVTEALYCYILSIFPNWTVQTHLHANQQMMDQVMNQVKILDPEASEQVKNWEIKLQETLNQAYAKQHRDEPKQEELRDQ